LRRRASIARYFLSLLGATDGASFTKPSSRSRCFSHSRVLQATQSGNARELEDVAVAEFKAIHANEPSLATLEMTDSKGIITQRGHNPSKRGDDKHTHPQVKSALEGKPAGGLTVSPTTGEAAEDSVMPLISGGSVIGTIKAGSYFNAATAAEIKQRTGLEIAFFSRGAMSASTLGKDQPLPVSPEMLSMAKNSPATVRLSMGNVLYRAKIVYLTSDVGEGMTIVFTSSMAALENAKWTFATSLAWKSALALLIVLPIAFFLAHLVTR
jgi:hypothetical protein